MSEIFFLIVLFLFSICFDILFYCDLIVQHFGQHELFSNVLYK